jgi:hypothetical protein
MCWSEGQLQRNGHYSNLIDDALKVPRVLADTVRCGGQLHGVLGGQQLAGTVSLPAEVPAKIAAPAASSTATSPGRCELSGDDYGGVCCYDGACKALCDLRDHPQGLALREPPA